MTLPAAKEWSAKGRRQQMQAVLELFGRHRHVVVDDLFPSSPVEHSSEVGRPIPELIRLRVL